MHFPLQKGLSGTWWEQLTRVVRGQEYLLPEERQSWLRLHSLETGDWGRWTVAVCQSFTQWKAWLESDYSLFLKTQELEKKHLLA